MKKVYFDDTIKPGPNVPASIINDLNKMKEILDNDGNPDEFQNLAIQIDIDIRSCMVANIVTIEEGEDVRRIIGFQ